MREGAGDAPCVCFAAPLLTPCMSPQACFKETRYEPENNYGIESRIAFFEWLTPQKPPAVTTAPRLNTPFPPERPMRPVACSASSSGTAVVPALRNPAPQNS